MKIVYINFPSTYVHGNRLNDGTYGPGPPKGLYGVHHFRLEVTSTDEYNKIRGGR